MEKKEESKKIKVCIGAYNEAAYNKCTAKVKALKAAGFKDAKVEAGTKYNYVIAGEYDDKEKAAEAMKEIAKLGYTPYEVNIKG